MTHQNPFPVGTEVVVNGIESELALFNDTGVVTDVYWQEAEDTWRLGVCFDDVERIRQNNPGAGIINFHTNDYTCPEGRGWYVDEVLIKATKKHRKPSGFSEFIQRHEL